MTSSYTPTTVSQGFGQETAINTNFTDIKTALDEVLNRVSSVSNAMSVDLDFNNNDLLNCASGQFTNLTLAGTTLSPTTVQGIPLPDQTGNAGLYLSTDGSTLSWDGQALKSIEALTTLADRMIYTTAADTYAVTPFTAFGRSLVDDVDATAARSTLGLGDLATNTLVGITPDIKGGRKNLIIGGDFHTNPWQRGTSFVAPSSSDYTADRWRVDFTSSAVFDITKDSDAPTVAESGVHTDSSLRLDVTTADASIAAGDNVTINQRMEGYDWSRIAERQFTLSFWVKATKTGIYCVAFRNSGNDRSFVAEYTVNTTNTWEYKTVTVSANPTAGTWDYTNGIGLIVSFTLAAGSTFQTTAGAWQTGNFVGTSNQVNALDNTANDFRINLVQIEEGATATDFEQRTFYEELTSSQRYFNRLIDGTIQHLGTLENFSTTQTFGMILPFTVEMRAVPTMSVSAVGDFLVHNSGGGTIATTGFTFSESSKKSTRANITVASGLVAGDATVLKSAASGSPTLDADAEL